MKVDILFDGGMGEFLIKAYISENMGTAEISVEPNVINSKGCVIVLPNIELQDELNFISINIRIKGCYPNIKVNVDIHEKYKYSTYVFYGYRIDDDNEITRRHGLPFAHIYKCKLQGEKHYKSLPF